MHSHDQQQNYCRKLGHHLTFSYCRSERNGKPCPMVFDCWFEKFDIGSYMKTHFQPEDVAYIGQGKPDKVMTLLELIQRAQNTALGAK